MKKLFVLFGAVALLVAFTAPVFAAEWSFYGSARVAMFWQSNDPGDLLGPEGDATASNYLDYGLQGNARIGANVKASDNLTGRFEYGGTANMRLLYGTYDFGGFKLKVGQDYRPVGHGTSNQTFAGDNGMATWGGIYAGRHGQVEAKIGGFSVALVAPPSEVGITDPETGITYGVNTKITYPMLDAAYVGAAGGFSWKVYGSYAGFDAVGPGPDYQKEAVNGYILGGGAKLPLGPVTLGASAYVGKNIGNVAVYTETGSGFAGWDSDAEKIRDSNNWGWVFVAGFTLSDMMSFEGGIGSAYSDMDGVAYDQTASAWYIQSNIAFAKGVFIVPEIGQVTYGDNLNGEDVGKTTYYGLKWQINF